MAKPIPAYHGIKQIHEDWLREALTSAPHYGIKAASAIGRVIHCIQGLQDLHSARDLSESEVYIGRATKSKLHQRWNAYAESHDHRYGAITFCCDPDQVERLEDLAVRILTKFKKRHLLCGGMQMPHHRAHEARSQTAEHSRSSSVAHHTDSLSASIFNSGIFNDWTDFLIAAMT